MWLVTWHPSLLGGGSIPNVDPPEDAVVPDEEGDKPGDPISNGADDAVQDQPEEEEQVDPDAGQLADPGLEEPTGPDDLAPEQDYVNPEQDNPDPPQVDDSGDLNQEPVDLPMEDPGQDNPELNVPPECDPLDPDLDEPDAPYPGLGPPPEPYSMDLQIEPAPAMDEEEAQFEHVDPIVEGGGEGPYEDELVVELEPEPEEAYEEELVIELEPVPEEAFEEEFEPGDT